MSTKHRPGPWTNKDHNDETSAIFAGEDRDLIANARAVSDARLIAAAPDLLAALRDAVCIISRVSETVLGGKGVGKSLERARAALAKAGGAQSNE